MDSIRFKNFRKFKEETTFELNNINILVGPNNSGKSTLTKGLRLYLYNILNLKVSKIYSSPFFDFNCSVFNNPHIGTFGRAISKDADSNDITFSACYNNFTIETIVSRYSVHFKDPEGNLRDYYNSTTAPITKIIFFIHNLDTRFTFDFEEGTLTRENNVLRNCLSYKTEIKDLPDNIFQMKSRLYPTLLNDIKFVSVGRIPNINSSEVLDEAFRAFIRCTSFIHIEAHSVTHSLVYNISDKNDYMAQTIMNYMNQNIIDSDQEKQFIKDWMIKFNIGEDFHIESFGGECYKFEIIEDKNHPEIRTPLLDKGVGSNQIMILLLQLATLMRINGSTTSGCSIIIEEPEQNLHPQLQSKLAELFLEVYQYSQRIKKNGKNSMIETVYPPLPLSFIIETHSEYLVRKIQVLVARLYKEGQGSNPFKVFYVTGDYKTPLFEMGFQRNGKFIKNFGEGFYDVADDAAMELFDMDNEEN